MAKNGKWQITCDGDSELGASTTRTFDTRREAADYAGPRQAAGEHDLIVTTPDGRTGTLGCNDGSVTSRWI